jgi:hypothetical protein
MMEKQTAVPSIQSTPRNAGEQFAKFTREGIGRRCRREMLMLDYELGSGDLAALHECKPGLRGRNQP